MLGLLFSFNALTVFLILMVIGFVFLLVSFLLGDLLEHHDWGLETNGAAHGPGWLNSRVLSIFVTAFGGFGAIGMLIGLGTAISSLLGLAGGLVLGACVFFFGRLLYRQQASSSVSAHDLVGRVAQVTVTIQSGSIGQICCRFGEERIEKLARARNGMEIQAGTIVIIEEVKDEIVIVSPDENIAQLFLPANS
jgi:hypothetical protein